jgi:hypothetical protein
MLIFPTAPTIVTNHILVVHQAHTADQAASRLMALALPPTLLLPHLLGLPRPYRLYALLRLQVLILLRPRRCPLILGVGIFLKRVLEA